MQKMRGQDHAALIQSESRGHAIAEEEGARARRFAVAGCRAGAAESSGYGVAGVVCGCGGGSLLEQQPAIEAGGEVGVALARLAPGVERDGAVSAGLHRSEQLVDGRLDLTVHRVDRLVRGRDGSLAELPLLCRGEGVPAQLQLDEQGGERARDRELPPHRSDEVGTLEGARTVHVELGERETLPLLLRRAEQHPHVRHKLVTRHLPRAVGVELDEERRSEQRSRVDQRRLEQWAAVPRARRAPLARRRLYDGMQRTAAAAGRRSRQHLCAGAAQRTARLDEASEGEASSIHRVRLEGALDLGSPRRLDRHARQQRRATHARTLAF
mmetsp:Transcript_37190/g.122690  ORF Transcript_37190/g.122690 Transcript_37190/m.122690 type:complete len:326 (-) Transcript_37190:41-1018(-)